MVSYTCDLFHGVTILLFLKQKEKERYAKKHGFHYERDEGVAGDFTYNDGTEMLLGWYNGRVGTLAHECVHACWRLLDRHGVSVYEDNHEVMAYLMGNMVEYFLNELAKK